MCVSKKNIVFHGIFQKKSIFRTKHVADNHPAIVNHVDFHPWDLLMHHLLNVVESDKLKKKEEIINQRALQRVYLLSDRIPFFQKGISIFFSSFIAWP
jgi:hypothetical protein